MDKLINELKTEIQKNCKQGKSVTIRDYLDLYMQKGYEQSDIEKALIEVMKALGYKKIDYYT